MPARPPFVLTLLLAIAALSCQPIPPGALPPQPDGVTRPVKRIAFVGAMDGSSGGPVTRALEGARLAFDQANIDGIAPVDLNIITVNTQRDPVATAEAVAEKVVADPDVIGVIGWPTTPEAGTLRGAVRQAGIAYVGLSPAEGGEQANDERAGDVQLVVGDHVQVAALSHAVRAETQEGDRICLGGDGDLRGASLVDGVAQQLERHSRVPVRLEEFVPGEPASSAEVAAIREAGCSVVVFAGSGTDAAALRTSLDAANVQAVRLFGPDTVRNEAFLQEAGASADGSVTTCSCVLVPDDGDLAVRSFIQAYQATYGGTPGAYSLEGADAAGIITSAVADGATDRAQLAASIGALQRYDGLAHVYRFDASGRVRGAGATVTVARADGGRWIERESATTDRR